MAKLTKLSEEEQREALRQWPPKKSTWGPLSLFKRAEAVLFRRRLVWLRDYDGRPTLSVARNFGKRDADGYQPVRAARFWPQFRKVSLLDDGSVEKSEHADYVVQWIPVEEKAQLAAYMKNHDTYAVLPED